MSLIVTLVVLLGCRPAPPDSGHDTSRAPPIVDKVDLGGFVARNVIIVNVDTLRADSLLAYGGLHDTLPRLDARGGWVVVDHDVATGSWTAPATASLFTGLDPSLDGVRDIDSLGRLNSALVAPTFAAYLLDAGVQTGLFTGNPVLEGGDLSKGFAKVVQDTTKPKNSTILAGDALDWIDGLPPDNRFVVVFQPMDVHEPFEPDPEDVGTWSTPSQVPFDLAADAGKQEEQWSSALNAATSDADRQALVDQIRDVYDEQILSVDRGVDAFLAGLDARGLSADTLVVFAADHGESIYDGTPPQIGHGGVPRHELAHVPLMFLAPGVPGTVQPCTASGEDLFPTVLDVMSLPAMPDVEGQSLLHACRDHAFSYDYEFLDGSEALTFASVESASTQILVDCHAKSAVAFDLSADPGTKAPVDPDTLVDGPALVDALQTQQAAIAQVLPWVSCSP